MENMEDNSEKIWKIQNKIVKRYEKYGKKRGKIWNIWQKIVKRYGKYRRKAS